MAFMSSEHSRRETLKLAGLAGLSFLVAPGNASATPEEVSAAIAKIYGDKKFASGKIKLDVPEIAENGLVVPLGFEVESPMSDKDYVKRVAIFAEANPSPVVAAYNFTSAIPKASAQLRIRLAATQNIIAIAEMSDGKLFSAKADVKVTIGGCGG